MERPPRNPFLGQLTGPRARTPRPPDPGTALEGPAHPAPGLLDAVVDWGLYRDGVRQPAQPFPLACEAARAGDGFLWLGVHEPSVRQLAQLGVTFGLHPLAVEDAANPRQRPKLEKYDDMLFLSLRTLAYVE